MSSRMAASTSHSSDSSLRHQEIPYSRQSIPFVPQWKLFTDLGVDRGVPEVWGSVYDIRDLLDSSVKLMDGKSPLEIELPGPLNLLKKPLLKLVDGNVVGDLLKEHGIIKEDMVK